MDVDFLSGMIGELMLDHDSLGLPGLGTFVAEEMPASFSDRGYTVNPPYRRLSFTERASDDTLLLDLYAGANPQAPKEAEAVLLSFLKELKEELELRKTVDLPGLGRLRATRENHFFFVADEALDISPEACGLSAVSLKTHGAAAVTLPEISGQAGNDGDTMAGNDATDASVPRAAAGGPAVVPQTAEPSEARPRRQTAPVVRWAIVVAAAAALALAGFAALARLAPDFTDKLLYTQEELEIINYPEDGLGLPG